MEKSLIVRIVFVLIAFGVWCCFKRISETEWRVPNPKTDSRLEYPFKWCMRKACTMYGFRLMCERPDQKSGLFPAEEAKIQDVLIGSLFYSILFDAALWISTPLPDITTNLFLLVTFDPRANNNAAAEQVPAQGLLLHMMRQGGGEGLVVADPPDPPEEN